jgi:hypothetical protein
MQSLSASINCTSKALAGVGLLEYCPVDELTPGQYHRALSAAYNQQRDAGVGTWYKLPYQPETGRVRESTQNTQQGPNFQITVSATLLSESAVQRGTLDDMVRHAFIVRVTRNNLTILLGTPEHPLTFNPDYDSGAAPSDTRAHQVAFSGVVIKKSPGYLPIF